MTRKFLTTLFSRILFVLGGGGIVVFAYTLILTLLAPVSVPPAPPAPASVSFDPTLDVTKNAIFDRLRQIGPPSVEIGAIGRPNPFISPPTTTRELPFVPASGTHGLPSVASTTTSESAATTTATSTS